jgi:hypothetical protein
MTLSAKKASAIIRKGLAKGKTQIEFPRRFTVLLHLLAALPRRWQIRLFGKIAEASS